MTVHRGVYSSLSDAYGALAELLRIYGEFLLIFIYKKPQC